MTNTKKQSQAKEGHSPRTGKDIAVSAKSNKAVKTVKRTTVPTQRETRSRPARQPKPSASPDGTPSVAATTVASPSPPKQPRPKARRSQITEGEARRPLGEIDANREMTREEMMAENRLLRQELEDSRRVAHIREVERDFRSIERPTERKRNNPYDIAPLRRILGLEVMEGDPDVLKELKNETYNYLRELARDTVGDQEIAKTIARGAHWDSLDPTEQLNLRNEFTQRLQKGGAMALTFFHSVTALNVNKFSSDWPVNELLKTVLRDQRVQMWNTKSKVLYGNSLYNQLKINYPATVAFPSASVVSQFRKPKQGRVGRPRADRNQQAAAAISAASKARFVALDKSIRRDYRALSHTPEFSFDDQGRVIMPPKKPLIKKTVSKSDTGAARSRSPSDPPELAMQAGYAENTFNDDRIHLPHRITRLDHGVNLDEDDDSEEDHEQDYPEESVSAASSKLTSSHEDDEEDDNGVRRDSDLEEDGEGEGSGEEEQDEEEEEEPPQKRRKHA